MTLDEALEMAARVEVCKACAQRGANALARFVLETLGAQMPCGFDEPTVEPQGDHYSTVEWVHGPDVLSFDPDEAIAIGAALVRAGLDAKGGG